MHRFLSSMFVAFFLLAQAPMVSAQNFASTKEAASFGLPTLPAVEATGTLNCFDYYSFGSVSADLQATVGQSVPGATLTFKGEVVSKNPYPLLNGTLYVKIFKRDETTFAEGDGNPIVDQFIVKGNIMLAANGKLPVSYEWKIPTNAEGGEYYAAYFFTTSNRYNLMGLTFTDDVVGNQAPFKIMNEIDAKIAKLSKISTTLNGQDHHFAAFPLHFAAGDTVTVETVITNPSDEEKTVPLQWNQYSWDAMLPENLRHTKTELVTVPANGEVIVSYEVRPQRESIVYVTAVTQDRETKSILGIRYVRDGIEETRINFPAVTVFPIKKDTEATLFACAHSLNLPVVPGNTLTLTLTDRDGKVIHEYRYEGDISGAMSGYGEKFTPTSNINYAFLTATLERNGVIVEQVKTEYDCKVIDPSSCLPEEGIGVFDWLKNNAVVAVLSVVILLLTAGIIAFLIKRRRHRGGGSSPMTTPIP